MSTVETLNSPTIRYASPEEMISYNSLFANSDQRVVRLQADQDQPNEPRRWIRFYKAEDGDCKTEEELVSQVETAELHLKKLEELGMIIPRHNYIIGTVPDTGMPTVFTISDHFQATTLTPRLESHQAPTLRLLNILTEYYPWAASQPKYMKEIGIDWAEQWAVDEKGQLALLDLDPRLGKTHSRLTGAMSGALKHDVRTAALMSVRYGISFSRNFAEMTRRAKASVAARIGNKIIDMVIDKTTHTPLAG
jgi:hypothetical protein